MEKAELSKILLTEVGISDTHISQVCDTLFKAFDPNQDGKFQYHGKSFDRICAKNLFVVSLTHNMQSRETVVPEFCILLQLGEGDSQGLAAKIQAMHSNS